MGNGASNKSVKPSPNTTETAASDAGSRSGSSPNKGCSPSPKGKSSDAADNRNRTLDKKMLLSALQAHGEGIAESELNSVLPNHDNYIDALNDIFEMNLARKIVKAHPPGPISRRRITATSSSSSAGTGGENRLQENIRPPLLPSPGGTTTSNKRKMITQKRPPALDDERPAKRPTVTTASPAFSLLGGGSGCGLAAPKPLGNLFAQAMRRQEPAASAAATRFFERDDAGAESTESEERPGPSAMRVDKPRPLMALKQGSPQRQQWPALALSMVSRKPQQQQQQRRRRPERSSSPTAMSDTPASRGFAVPEERFTLGKMGASMLKGVDRWPERTREQQDEAVRLILNDLRLSPLGLGRREKFESELSDRIYMAMESLSQGFNAQDG
ncbi:unnamed protein product [Ectocarpus sp. 4 AP-2014]